MSRMEGVPGWPLTKQDLVTGSTFHSMYMYDLDKVKASSASDHEARHLLATEFDDYAAPLRPLPSPAGDRRKRKAGMPEVACVVS